ncbi:sensor histidine kinase [Leptospira interrogans]
MDLETARVTSVNAAGRALWGDFLLVDRTVDRAMPALSMLREATPEEQIRTLTFWLGPSSVEMRCACRRLAEGSSKVLVAAVDTVSDKPPILPSYARPKAGIPDLDDRMTRATLAHELRTPLSAIMALAEVMKDERLGEMGNARYLVYAADIYDSARHALSVLGDMLVREPGEPETEASEADAEDIVRKCLSAMRELAKQASVELAVDFRASHGRVAIDRRSLTQILLNLLSNALKFTPAGGTVTVSTLLRPDGALELSVHDTGMGMLQDDIDQVLSPSADPAKPRNNGSGFGLPLVKALVAASGGALDMESKAGQGTRVSVIYPRERVLGPVAPHA